MSGPTSSRPTRRLPPWTTSRIVLSGLAFAAALAVVPLKTALNDAAGGDVGVIPAFAAVVVSAWLGGFVPGIVATATGIVVEAVVFMQPEGSLTVDRGRLQLAMFGLTGALASWLAWLRTRAENQARSAIEEANRARDRVDLTARRLGALQALASDLAGAASGAEMADVLLDRGLVALQADGATMYRLEPDGEAVTARARRGIDGDEAAVRLPLGATTPATDAVRTGEPVFIEQPADYLARYGEALTDLGASPLPQAIAVVPLQIDSRQFGALAFSWTEAHELAPDRRAFIASIGRLGAGALDRTRLFDAERAARRLAESAQGRLDLLADAGRVIGLTLDYETTLRRLAGLAVPLMGDLCIVDVLAEEGVRRLVTTADGVLAGPATVIESRPPELSAGGPIGEVIRSGRASVLELDDETVASISASPDQAAAYGAISARWALVAPLRVLERTTGAVTFLRREDRRYDAEEIAVAEELGERAGRALENARLHREVGRLADRERRHASELEAVVAAIGEGILVAEAEGTIRSSNSAAVRLLGGPVHTTAQLLDRLLDATGDRPTALPTGSAEYRLARRPTAWVEVTAYPVSSAGLPATPMVIVCRDVTAFRQGQALREAFLGLLSHELRTPVTTIYGGSAVLARPGSAIDPQTRAEILADIAAEADRLYRLVEDLLVLARFDEGFEVGAEPALLQHIVPAVLEQERSRWPAVHFELDLDPNLPTVSGDETSITQVLRNLFSNAAKYSGRGTEVEVVVEAVPEGVAVRVRDEGPGIDPSEAEDLFDPFYRSPSTAKMAGGAGIGLYVSRRLVDAMNGRMWAAPRDGHGSEFAFVLPRYTADAEDLEVAPAD